MKKRSILSASVSVSASVVVSVCHQLLLKLNIALLIVCCCCSERTTHVTVSSALLFPKSRVTTPFHSHSTHSTTATHSATATAATTAHIRVLASTVLYAAKVQLQLQPPSDIQEQQRIEQQRIQRQQTINEENEHDQLIARAAKLRQSIVKQQAELIELEQQIECRNIHINKSNNNNNSNNNEYNNLITNITPIDYLNNKVNTTIFKFINSANVFQRKLERVKQKVGPKNKQYTSQYDFLLEELQSGVRIVSNIVQRPQQITHLIDPSTPTLLPHVPAIMARLDQLESHVEPILERVLNNRQHLYSVEPYLDEILERFDDIEPHLTWILDNIDVLAPNTGLLLKHIDALLLFAESDDDLSGDSDSNSNSDSDSDNNNTSDDYSLANQLLPYLEYYVSKLDVIGPHLVLLRPHVPLLLKQNRIAKISPHIDKLFASGYKDLGTSANMDILLFWFGWSLRVPFLPALFFSLPFSPQLVMFLANRLPKKFARKGKSYCRRLRCTIDDDYGNTWNKLESRSVSS